MFSKGMDTPNKVIDNVERKLKDLGIQIHYKYNTVIRGFAFTLDTDKVQTLEDFNDKDYPFILEADQTVTINE